MMEASTQQHADGFVPQMPPPVVLTPKAAEMVHQAMEQENLPGHGLRVGVVGGGCSGLQYALDFVEAGQEEDFESVQYGIRVFIDPYSAAHLVGTTVDFAEGLQGSGFKFENPNVQRACGCGSSFQT